MVENKTDRSATQLQNFTNDELYKFLITAKNEWNKRAADFDTYPNLKKVYLHFENSLASTHKTKIK